MSDWRLSQRDTIKSMKYKLLRVVCKDCVGISKGTKEQFITIFHHFLTDDVSQPKVISVLNPNLHPIVVGISKGTRSQRRGPLKPLNTEIVVKKKDIKHVMKKGAKSIRKQVKQGSKQKVVKKDSAHEMAKKDHVRELTTEQRLIQEQKLIQEQQLELESIEQKLTMFTATQLKQECQQAHIFTKGNKAQLISRLAQHILKQVVEKDTKQQSQKSNAKRKQTKHDEDCTCDHCDLEFALLLANLEVSTTEEPLQSI